MGSGTHAGEIGRQIRDIRVSRHIRRIDVSKATGISVPALCNLETGKSNPTLETLSRVGECVGFAVRIVPEDVPPDRRAAGS